MSLVLTRRDGEGLTFTGPGGAVIHIECHIFEQFRRKPKTILKLDAPADWLISRDELLKDPGAAPAAATALAGSPTTDSSRLVSGSYNNAALRAGR